MFAQALLLSPFLAIGLLVAAEAEVSLRPLPASAPPGAFTQVAFELSRPASIESGRVTISLDPVIFERIAAVDLLGSGSFYGYGSWDNATLRASFRFLTPGGEQAQQLAPSSNRRPLLVVTAVVKGTAPLGVAATAVRIEQLDLAGEGITPAGAGNSGAIEVVNPSRGLSVENVLPRAGALDAGTHLLIKGTGFDPGASVTIESIPLEGDARVISREWIELTLASPATDLAGRRLSIRNTSTGATLDYFIPAQRLATAATGAARGVTPFFPGVEFTLARSEYLGRAPNLRRALAVRNRGTARADVVFDSVVLPGEAPESVAAFSVDPGETYICEDCEITRTDTPRIRSSAPVQMLALATLAGTPIDPHVPEPDTPDRRAFWVSNPVSARWVAGSPAIPPLAETVEITTAADDVEIPFDAEAFVFVESGGGVNAGPGWFTVSADRFTARGPGLPPPARLTVRFFPAGLGPGDYRGRIRLTGRAGEPARITTHWIPVRLTVDAAPAAP